MSLPRELMLRNQVTAQAKEIERLSALANDRYIQIEALRDKITNLEEGRAKISYTNRVLAEGYNNLRAENERLKSIQQPTWPKEMRDAYLADAALKGNGEGS